MSISQSETQDVVITDRDIVFDCPSCGGELVVDRDGEGMQLGCVHCGAPIIVPPFAASKRGGGAGVTMVASASQVTIQQPKVSSEIHTFDFSSLSPDMAEQRIEELKLQLKENESQRVETRGHLNRTMLQAHRYQLALQKLVDRQSAIEQEVAALKKHLEG